MAYYSYDAKDARGQAHKGTVEAASSEEAGRKLRGQGLWVTDIRHAKRARTRRVPLEAQGRFFTDLADLLGAGLSLDRALSLIASNQTHAGFRRVVDQLLEEVRGGGDLSTAVGKFRDVFGEVAGPMLKAGESTGNLAIIARRLGEYVERQRQFRSALITALAYPSALIAMSLLSGVVLLVYVIPKFAEIFESLRQEVPVFTRGLLALGTWLQDYGVVLPLALVLALLFWRYAQDRPELRLAIEKRVLRLPLIGRLIFMRELARFCSTLGAMLQGGVPLVRALTLVEGAVSSAAIREMIAPLKNDIRTGGTMSAYFRAREAFPPRLSTMLRIAEEQGAVGEGLTSLGTYFEGEFQAGVKRFLTFLEPGVIILTGLMIAAMVMSMFTAIFGINDVKF